MSEVTGQFLPDLKAGVSLPNSDEKRRRKRDSICLPCSFTVRPHPRAAVPEIYFSQLYLPVPPDIQDLALSPC